MLLCVKWNEHARSLNIFFLQYASNDMQQDSDMHIVGF